MNRNVYPYDGEAIRFRECIDGLIRIGGQIRISESGELEVISREPVPPALVAELRYFKRSLSDFYGPNRLPLCPNSQTVSGNDSVRNTPLI